MMKLTLGLNSEISKMGNPVGIAIADGAPTPRSLRVRTTRFDEVEQATI